MKKLLIVMCTVLLVTAASAQHRVYVRPPVVIHSYVPVYSSLGYGFGYGYAPYYGYPPAYYGNNYRPSKLDNQIADINHDYDEKIESARMDKNLSRKDRRHEIRELKMERDRKIDDAKRNYYKQ